MYFNDNNSTNIDGDFNNKKQFKISKKLLIIGIVFIIVILFVGIIFVMSSKIDYFLMLNGSSDMVVYQYDEFIDLGYQAYDSKGNEYNQDVVVIGEVNTDIAGEYQIRYQYRDKEVVRVVTVLPVDEGITFLILKGEMTMFLNVGDVYQEPGYMVLDSVSQIGNDIVQVTGNVNTSKPGTYKITYTLNKNNDSKLVEERTVIVMGSDISISYSPTSYTKNKVTISVTSNDNYFDYIILPDGSKNNQRSVQYDVTKNGGYKFKIYSKNGTFKEENIEINNIDTVVPSGSCSGYYLENKTYLKINASDSISGINKYVVNGNEYKTNNITLTGELKSVNVTLFDKVGNKKDISCQLEDKNPVTNRCNDKTIYPGHKYTFTQAEKEKMAAMISTEADGDPKKAEDFLGMKLVASHMCNYYEKLYPNEEWSGKRLHWLITTGSWYADMTKNSKYNHNNERHQLALCAVEEVMEKGNRILPHYIDEFDMFPKDVMTPLSNIDDYISGETIYYGYKWTKATFWCINYMENSKTGNIFGYSKK